MMAVMSNDAAVATPGQEKLSSHSRVQGAAPELSLCLSLSQSGHWYINHLADGGGLAA